MSTIVILPKKKGRKKQRGGLLPALLAANSIAQTIKPASIASNVIDSLGKRDAIGKSKIGKVFLSALNVGKKLGYGKRKVGRPRKIGRPKRR